MGEEERRAQEPTNFKVEQVGSQEARVQSGDVLAARCDLLA